MSGVFDEALGALEALAASGGTVIAAIDGRCGSGKTTLARLAAKRLGCAVVHTDDFYLPLYERRAGWQNEPCANMDLARLRSQVLEPFRAGERAAYRPFRCREMELGPETVLPAGGLLLVEGSYSLHPALADLYDLKLFVTCDSEERYRRLQVREGERFKDFRRRWIPLEEAYFQQFGVERDAMRVDTSARIT